MSQQFCPIWKTPARVIPPRGRYVYHVYSPRASGHYDISDTGYSVIDAKLEESQKTLLTSWLIHERTVRNRAPYIDSGIDLLVSELCPLSPDERANNLLKYIKQHTRDIGDHFEFDTNPNPDFQNQSWIRYAEMLAWSESSKSSELDYLLGSLEGQGWIRRLNSTSSVTYCYSITYKGDDHLSQLSELPVNRPLGFRVSN